ncbi:MAG: hypothetical protein P8X63_03655, partial [Desulfuromonadaceae bacterium]
MLQRLLDRNSRAVFKYPLHYLTVLVLLTGLFGYFYAQLPVETSVESLIIENDPDLLFYEKFKAQFGEDEFLVVAFTGPEIFSAETLTWIAQKNDELESIEEVREVVSLTTVEEIIGTDYDFIVQPLVEQGPETPEGLLHIRQRALDNPLIDGALVSNDGSSALFLIRTESHPGDESYDARLVEKVHRYFADDAGASPGIEWHLAGWLVTDV